MGKIISKRLKLFVDTEIWYLYQLKYALIDWDELFFFPSLEIHFLHKFSYKTQYS